MEQKGKNFLDALPELGQQMAKLLMTLRQAAHLLPLTKQSHTLRNLIPETMKSMIWDSYFQGNAVIQLYQSGCELSLDTSLTEEQKESITAFQNALNEIKIVHAELLSLFTSEPQPGVENVSNADIKQALKAIQTPFH
jgi:S-adenosylmethionine:diacylglycerol 3-amino-3-carboxypropyl transferase